MVFPCLTIVMILIALLTYKIRVSDRKMRNSTKEFWEKEQRANNTRRQSLDSLSYIEIPIEQFPMEADPDETITACQQRIRRLADEKIVNMSGITNTDLKLAYGAPNLDLLASYDQNCTELLRTLFQWGEALFNAGQYDAAKTVLEFGVSCKTDISKHYTLLAEIYKKENTPHKIQELIHSAEELTSMRRNAIIGSLNKIFESCHAPG